MTPKGTVPLDRDFGIDLSLLDMPQNAVNARLTNEIARAIAKYEPRAAVLSATYSGDLNGNVTVDLTLEV